MESLNLNNLASSLPPSNLAKAEMDLTDNFKGAQPSPFALFGDKEEGAQPSPFALFGDKEV